ncbi:hypothetical protein T484DRAFT_1841695, partial [Baffinella frigidus]
MLFLLGSYAVPTKNIIATLAVLLMQHGATASDCRTTVTDGWYHTCAILDDATVKCWGYNANGELGYGDTDAR